MLDQLVEFLKRAFVQQKLDAFARRQLAGRVLLFDSRGAAACFGLFLTFAKSIELG